MMILLKHFLRSAIDWLFRRRSPALLTMRIGFGCMALAFGTGLALDLSFPFGDGKVNIDFDNAVDTPIFIVYVAAFVGGILIILGSIWEIVRYRAEQKRINRKKVIVIEGRGLRNSSGLPLVEALPPELEGQRDHVLVDIRQQIKDGEIVSPESALENLVSLPSDLKRRENGFDRRDLSLVYGGLMPVPFTFLMGVLVDDEGAIFTLDWDRHAETWRKLDGADDGKRFNITDAGSVVPDNTNEIAMTVSVSYGIMVNDIREQVGDIPSIELKLDGGSPDCHWSEEKQRALGQQFLNTAIDLSNRGVKRIHLFLAAQNSLSFRLGRLYDKRNLPEIIVYQFQRDSVPPYPWGILMPVSGKDKPEIIRELFG